MSASQSEIVQAAREMADLLAAAPEPVSRNTFLTLISPHLAGRSREELRRALELVEQGSGGHLKRPGTFADQVRGAVPILRADLDATDLDSADYRSFLGWVARLLEVRRGFDPEPQGRGREDEEAARSSEGQRPPERGRGAPGSGRRGRRAPLTSVKPQGLSALEEMKRRLQEQEGGKG